ncbi:2996_t:CDS:2, partial [Dentiscutata heterogama]
FQDHDFQLAILDYAADYLNLKDYKLTNLTKAQGRFAASSHSIAVDSHGC